MRGLTWPMDEPGKTRSVARPGAPPRGGGLSGTGAASREAPSDAARWLAAMTESETDIETNLESDTETNLETNLESDIESENTLAE